MNEARILIVEDEIITAMDLQQRLAGLGYEVAGRVSNGVAAVSQASELRPDLILMDIHLKGEMDGIEAAEHIRSQCPTPIIFLTAFADVETLQRAKVTEAFGYIIKPFEERELSVSIEIALYRHRLEQRLRDSEARLQAIFDAAFDGLFVIDMQGRFVNVNPAGCSLTGYTHEEILAADFRRLLFPEDALEFIEQEKILSYLGTGTREVRLRRKDGVEIWVELTLTLLHLSSDEYILGTVQDITTRRRAEAELRASQERYMLAAQGANDGLWDWNLSEDRIYYSPRWKSILGYQNDEIGSRPEDWLERVHPDDQIQLRMELAAHLKGQTQHFESEHRIQHKDGTYRWVLTRGLAVQNEQGIAYRIAGSQSDTTDRKRVEEQLLYDAFHDALTGLPNRALFQDRLSQAIERSNRQDDYAFGMLFLDLDQFKVVNDSLGHTAGDELLISTARLLENCIRTVDTVARLGGDEFVILLDDPDHLEGTIEVAERIQTALQSPFILGEKSLYTSTSIGIVFSERGYERPEDALRDADIAMYQAKSQGKSRYVVFDPQMLRGAVARLELENDLRRAYERGEFQLYYQPIMTLAENKIVGFESLLRWHHPKQGFIPPADFIPLAEETGLIIPIGRWVLREACRQMQDWQERFPVSQEFYVSVNISAKQLMEPGFTRQVLETLQESGLAAKQLCLEITESILMENNGVCEAAILNLREQGLQVFIDDFGTGYSSLSYIQRFPVKTIKIDRSFINQIGHEGNNTELLASILRFAFDLELEAIAEGVETSQQLAQLKSLLCNYGQGYYISKPLDPRSAESLLSGAIWRGNH
ncbi:MAG TPA: EAL domain-containing protein [Anaerolineales bacterium]|nr:EAL domain-containing protein [Anaerolineales bacterium]